MKATIWHNPNCSTSRKALEALRSSGADTQVIEYLKHPPSKEELRQLFAQAGLSPREGLRMKEEDAKALVAANADDDAILDSMVAKPVLIERPLVRTDKGVRLCRPLEKVQDLL